MSWARQIKLLYSISLNMFFYIIWAMVSSIILSNEIDYRLFFIALMCTFIVQILNWNWNRPGLILIPVLLGIALVYLISEGSNIAFNSLFILFIVYMVNSFHHEEIGYEVYRERAKQAIIAILLIGVVIPLIDFDLTRRILKLYVMFVISIIWLLREVRGYAYKLKNKDSLKINIAISAAILMLAVDKVFLGLIGIFSALFNAIRIALSFVGDKIAELIIFIIRKPMEYLVSLLRGLAEKSEIIKNENVKVEVKGNKDILENGGEGLIIPEWITTAITVIILALVIYLIYKLLLKGRLYIGDSNDTAVEEKKETIRQEKNKASVFNKIQEFLTPKDYKTQTLYVFKKFQIKTFGKGIFKHHMTAKQLENVTKTYLKDSEGINNLTDIYNEAKFSQHQISEDKARAVKEEFNKVKKQI